MGAVLHALPENWMQSTPADDRTDSGHHPSVDAADSGGYALAAMSTRVAGTARRPRASQLRHPRHAGSVATLGRGEVCRDGGGDRAGSGPLTPENPSSRYESG